MEESVDRAIYEGKSMSLKNSHTVKSGWEFFCITACDLDVFKKQ